MLFTENIVYLESYINDQLTNISELMQYFKKTEFWQGLSNSVEYAKMLSKMETDIFDVETEWNMYLNNENDRNANNLEPPQKESIDSVDLSQALRALSHLKRKQRTCLQAIFTLFSRFHHCYQSLANVLNETCDENSNPARTELINVSTNQTREYSFQVLNVDGKLKLSIKLPAILKNLELCQEVYQQLSKNAISFQFYKYAINRHASTVNQQLWQAKRLAIKEINKSEHSTLSSFHQLEESRDLAQPSSKPMQNMLKSDNFTDISAQPSQYEASNEEDDEKTEAQSISIELSQTPLPSIRTTQPEDAKINSRVSPVRHSGGQVRPRTESQRQHSKQFKNIRAETNTKSSRKHKVTNKHHHKTSVPKKRPRTTHTGFVSGQKSLSMKRITKFKKNKSRTRKQLQPMEMKELLAVLQNQTNDMVNMVSLNSPSTVHNYIPLLTLKHDQKYIDQMLLHKEKEVRELKKSRKKSKKRQNSNEKELFPIYKQLSEIEKQRKIQERMDRDRIILIQNYKKDRSEERETLQKQLNEATTELERCNNRIITLSKQQAVMLLFMLHYNT